MSLPEETMDDCVKVDTTSLRIFINKLSKVFEKICEKNDNEFNFTRELIDFEERRGVETPLLEYILNLVSYLSPDKHTLVLSLIYLDRFCKINKVFLKYENFHRLFSVGLVVAIKFNEDHFYSNSFYSKIAGISPRKLLRLERMFFEKLNFELYVSEEEFNSYKVYFNKFF